MQCPVMNPASSEQRNVIADATSAGVAYRPIGTILRYDSRVFAEWISAIAVATGPGATELTVMPMGASSIAICLVSPVKAVFDVP